MSEAGLPGRSHPGPRHRAVEKSAAPEFEGDERPKMMTEILTGLMSLDEGGDIGRLEEASGPRRTREQEVSDETGQAPAEPVAQRHAETLFRTVDHGIGQDAAHRLLE